MSPRVATIAALVVALAGCGSTPRTGRLVVVGGGPAGLSAAIEAAATTHVVVLEASNELGGSARWAMGATLVPDAATVAAWEARWGPDPARTRYAERVRPDVVDWTTGLGVTWREVPNALNDGPLLGPDRGGQALVQALIETARAAGVELRTGARVTGLSRSGDDLAVTLLGGEVELGHAVVIATGGFSGSRDRVVALLGLDDVLVGGPAAADGIGLQLAGSLGGAIHSPMAAMLYGHGTPSPDDPARGAMVVGVEQGLVVDATGARVPGLEAPRGPTGDVLRAHGGRAWLVLDAKSAERGGAFDVGKGRFRPMRKLAQPHGLFPLGALAEAIGVPVEALQSGIAEGEPTPDRPLRRAERYLAVPLRVTVAKTLAGIEIDADGRVLDGAGNPVAGLYAAGEVAGFGHPYDGGALLDSTMVSGAILTGRMAGRAAGRQAALAGR